MQTKLEQAVDDIAEALNAPVQINTTVRFATSGVIDEN